MKNVLPNQWEYTDVLYLFLGQEKQRSLNMLKNIYKTALVTLAGLVGTANALEIRPLTEILFPTKVNLAYDKGGNKADIKWDTDLVFMIGSEILMFPVVSKTILGNVSA